jgi:hypothetical protein
MPVLANPRHEKFAQLLAQLHGEMTVTANIVLDRCRSGKEKAAELAALKLVRNN